MNTVTTAAKNKPLKKIEAELNLTYWNYRNIGTLKCPHGFGGHLKTCFLIATQVDAKSMSDEQMFGFSLEVFITNKWELIYHSQAPSFFCKTLTA